MVEKIWQSETTRRMPLERWQNKLRRLRQHLRGWAKHTARIYRKEKKKLLALLENLDKKAESVPLSDQEISSYFEIGRDKMVRESQGENSTRGRQ